MRTPGNGCVIYMKIAPNKKSHVCVGSHNCLLFRVGIAVFWGDCRDPRGDYSWFPRPPGSRNSPPRKSMEECPLERPGALWRSGLERAWSVRDPRSEIQAWSGLERPGVAWSVPGASEIRHPKSGPGAAWSGPGAAWSVPGASEIRQ